LGNGGVTTGIGGSAANGGGPATSIGGAAAIGGRPATNIGGAAVNGGGQATSTGGAPLGSGGFATNGGAATAATGGTSKGNGGASIANSGDSSQTGGASDTDAALRHEAPYPAISATTAGCGPWAFVDNVCCAQYCSNDNTSESCDKCGGPGAALCTPVNSKACISGEWPEVHSVGDNEDWHYSRSTHFGLTNGGACAFGYYGLCTPKFSFTDPILAAKCQAFCTAYPQLCQDPANITLRGNFAAPNGNYYTQFWPSLPGDRDNYLSCGECFELVRTQQDGTEYQPGDPNYTAPVVLQVVDSCPCSANSKWCCGSGRDHCGEIITGSFDFKYGCPLPPGNLPPNHDPEADESIHLDLSDIAMARLQSGDPNKGIVDGVIPTKYKRVPCPVVGNLYIWLRSGASNYYFALSVVNAGGPGSVTSVEAQLADGTWSTMHRDANYTSARPQERYGTWVVPQGAGPFALPMSLRIASPTGAVVTATGAVKSWAPTNTAIDPEMYYIDTGVQF
jgi:hypothetical protein